METFSDTGWRYVDQLQTTTETMRRRCPAFYDAVMSIGQRAPKLVDGMRDMIEPALYDLKDQVTTGISEQGTLADMPRDTRNILVELYLGVVLLLTGLSSGQLAGAFALSWPLSLIFNPFMDMTVLVLLFVHVYLRFRKQGMDDSERRMALFSLALGVGMLSGHLLQKRMFVSMPTVAFLQPLAFALLLDRDIGSFALFGQDRRVLLVLMSSAGVLLTMPVCILLSNSSMVVIFTALVHAAFLVFHFQMVMNNVSDKSFTMGAAQLWYLIGICAIQMPIALVFGGDN